MTRVTARAETSTRAPDPDAVRLRFDALTVNLSAGQWQLLGILASERKLAHSVLEKLARNVEPAMTEPAPQTWLAASLATGLLVAAGCMHTLASARNPKGECACAIQPEFRALTLRRIADRNELESLPRLARAVIGERSPCLFVSALYAGDLDALRLTLADLKWKFPSGEGAAFARSMLREALSSAFDAAWFERTWAEHAPLLAEQVLTDALFALDPVDAVYEWALARALASTDSDVPRLVRVLAEHALLRGEIVTLRALATRLPAAEQLAFRAACSYTEGDLAQAQRLLDDSFGWQGRKAGAPPAASVIALSSLLSISRGTAEGRERVQGLARRIGSLDRAPVKGFAAAGTFAAVGRGLRALLRYLSQPEHERTSLDAHQLLAQSSAWEALLLALTVHLHQGAPIPRAAWGQRLAASGERWSRAGYVWIGRQALFLANALSEAALGELHDLAPCRPGELLLVDLIQPEPPWRKSLDALAAFAKTAEPSEKILSLRVAWFVDMVKGELAKPMLEEFRSATGWTRGRRVELAELGELSDQLPVEDAAVLRCTTHALGRRELGPEALEALCGHPRVFNGARGRLPVEVVRGTCRIETRRELGHLVLHVEPAGAVEGVNLVVEGEARLVVYRITAAQAKLNSLFPSGVRIPEGHAEEALAILAQLADHVEIRGTELGAPRSIPADSTPCLRISPAAGAWWIEVGVRPFGPLGRFFPPGLGRARVTSHAGGELLDTARSFADEEARFAALLERCPTLSNARAREGDEGAAGSEGAREPSYSFTLDEEGLFSLLAELRTSEFPCALEWQNSRPITARGTLRAGDLHGTLRRIKGWYLATGGVRLEDATSIPLAELATMPFSKSGRFIRLPSGDFVEVERRIRQVLSALSTQAELAVRAPARELRVSDAAFDTLRALALPGSGFSVDASARAWLERVDAGQKSEYALPPGLSASLRPYQVEGYQWLCRASALGLGVCLADDMGLGKTLQILALLLTRAEAGPTLVIAPTSVCSNWIDEIARFAPTLTALEYSGKARAALLERFRPNPRRDTTQPTQAPDVLIASYALLQQDSDKLSSIEWNTLVLDEAQFIKNARSLRAKAAFGVPARYRVAMTGTPVENHLGDLWSIFHFLNPTLLGSFKNFQARFLKPIELAADSERQASLKNLINPFILRRRKDQVLTDLPPLTSVRHEVELSKDEAVRYALLRRQIHQKLFSAHGKREHKLEIFSEITRLRRFCCHPRLVFPEAGAESAKIQSFLELVEELRDNGHRALVFSQFVDFLELVRAELDERQIPYLYLDGSTPKEVRHARVNAFQAGEAELFLISLKAGGFGVNLTAADYVIHLDPWWNPAVEAQATDRAHRIGQSRPVTVYRLITKHSIEERIVELHHQKRALADAVLAGSELASALSLDDLREILGPAPRAP